MTARILVGDCLAVLATLAENSVDAIVTDPPYGLSFMGKKWDCEVPSEAIWRECLRVVKPGAHLLAFFGTRTYHRGVCAVEEAGFEIRDQIGWVFGTGFPKSHNGEWGGTALKPAWEPIVLARKPLIGTVEENWKTHGTGALNIDGCRLGGRERLDYGLKNSVRSRVNTYGKPSKSADFDASSGRWPANVIHDGSDEVVTAFPDSKTSRIEKPSNCATDGNTSFDAMRGNRPARGYDGDGSAARFFYCAKASKADRNDGCENIAPKQYSHDGRETPIDNAYQRNSSNSSNSHPTVKPTNLMRYLCRLVTPPDGIVLDPFMGSGSTGRGAVLEGFGFIGIERESEYVEIAKARIKAAEESLRGATANIFSVAA